MPKLPPVLQSAGGALCLEFKLMKKATINPVAIFALAFFCFLLPSSEAYADYTEPTSYSVSFLESSAEQAGLTPSEYVVSIALATNVTTGINSTTASGVSASKSLDDNLAALVPSQNWPDWDELSEEYKDGWHDSTTYRAAMFNDMVAAGFGARQAETDWYGSGGSNWDWDNYNFGERLHDIGQQFYNLIGSGATLGDIFGLVENSNENWYKDWIGNVSSVNVPGRDYNDWPSGAPESVNVMLLHDAILKYTVIGTGTAGDRTALKHVMTNRDVYAIEFEYPNNGYTKSELFLFDKQTFNYGQAIQDYWDTTPVIPSVTTSSTAQVSNSVYKALVTTSRITDTSLARTPISSKLSDTVKTQIAHCLLFGDEIKFTNAVDVSEYPENINADMELKIYLPTNGFNEYSTWNDYITMSSDPGGGGEGGTVDLSEIISLLQRNNELLERFKYDGLDLKVFDQRLNDLVEQFQFYANGELKIHDLGVYQILSDIYERIAFPTPEQVPEIIGDFDRETYEQKADALIPQLAGVAPFCAFAMLAKVIDYWGVNDPSFEPEVTVPFLFMPGQEETIEIDLTWLADLRPLVNFITLTLLLLTLANRTLDILQLEVTS